MFCCPVPAATEENALLYWLHDTIMTSYYLWTALQIIVYLKEVYRPNI